MPTRRSLSLSHSRSVDASFMYRENEARLYNLSLVVSFPFHGLHSHAAVCNVSSFCCKRIEKLKIHCVKGRKRKRKDFCGVFRGSEVEN